MKTYMFVVVGTVISNSNEELLTKGIISLNKQVSSETPTVFLKEIDEHSESESSETIEG